MYHGKPTWFELTTAHGRLTDADAFYAGVFGWKIADAGMEGFTYHLASHGGSMVAGLMEAPQDEGSPPPSWLIYFDVDAIDAAAAKVTTLGGTVVRPPEDIPGTGRFAILADPQGAVFGLLQPEPMDPQPPVEEGAWNQNKESHGNWVELMTSDPDAGLAFYSALLGWTKSSAVDMGEMGTYQLFRWRESDIGGMMGLGNAPVPCWLAYFGVNGVDAALERIRAGGGTIVHGPMEVPGSAFIAVAHDPQGAYFAVVGPKQHTP